MFPLCVLSHSKDTLHIKYGEQLTGFYNNGNNNSFYINTASNLVLENSKTKNNTICNYSYGQQTNVVNQNEYFFNDIFSYKLGKKLYAVALVELEQSYMRSIHLRSAGGVGVTWNISKSVSITDLFLLDETDYSDGSLLYIEHNSLRLRINHSFSKFTFKTEMYAMPDIKQKYFRFRSNMSLGYKLSKSVSFIVSLQDAYEQYVINNRLNNDFNLSFGLSISN